MGWMDGRYSTYRDGKYIEVGTIDDVCAQLKEMVESARESRDRAREELAAMKEETWKDEQLQKMKAEVKEMKDDYWRGFPISKAESEAISEWKNQHWTNQHDAPDNATRLQKMGAIGGSYHYEFTPTSIGTIGTICCSSCMRKIHEMLYREKFQAEKTGKKFDWFQRLSTLIEEYDAEFDFQTL